MSATPSPPSPPSPTSSPSIRPIRPEDRTPLARLVGRDGLFNAEEVRVALELIDAALADPDGEFRVRVATVGDTLAGYLCFGPTPMTDTTWDLYWIVTDPEHRGAGVGSALIEHLEREVRGRGARYIRVETSSTELYGSAQRFYQRHAYPVFARFPDFYRAGDDLLVLYKAV